MPRLVPRTPFAAYSLNDEYATLPLFLGEGRVARSALVRSQFRDPRCAPERGRGWLESVRPTRRRVSR